MLLSRARSTAANVLSFSPLTVGNFDAAATDNEALAWVAEFQSPDGGELRCCLDSVAAVQTGRGVSVP